MNPLKIMRTTCPECSQTWRPCTEINPEGVVVYRRVPHKERVVAAGVAA